MREAQETVKQLRRAAPSSIHDAAGQQLAMKSKDFDDILTTGVVDKSVPVRVRVPSDLCASESTGVRSLEDVFDYRGAAICDIAKAAKRLDKKCCMLKVTRVVARTMSCSSHSMCVTRSGWSQQQPPQNSWPRC